MNGLNSIILEGRIVNTSKKDDIVMAMIAVDRNYKTSGGEMVTETSFFDIKAYGKIAESLETHSEKGRGIRVVGRLKQERWTDEESGKTMAKTIIIAEHIEYKPFLKNQTKL